MRRQPRESPIRIVPRPNAEVQQHQSRQRSPSGVASHARMPRTSGSHAQTPPTNAPPTRPPPGRLGRTREPRKLTDNLQEDEYLTTVTLLRPDGKDWVELPNALVSPRWTGSYLSPETVEAMPYLPRNLTNNELHTSVTPRGPNRDDKVVAVWMKLEESEVTEEMLVALPILNKWGLGVSVIIGKPLIEAMCHSASRHPSGDAQYVNTDEAAVMPIFDMNQAASYYYNAENRGGIDAYIDPNVYWGQNDAMNYDLTGVGAGIPVGYTGTLFLGEAQGWLA